MDLAAVLTNSFDDDTELTSDVDQGGIVIPNQTCEHVQLAQLCDKLPDITNHQCVDCESTKENWLCLSCGEIHCSRYVNNHGEGHWLFTLLTDEAANTGHCLTISLQDLSVWCYPCKSYIKNIRLKPLIKRFEAMKFGEASSSEPAIAPDRLSVQSLTLTEATRDPSTIIAIQDVSLLKELKKVDLLSHCYTMKFRSASIDELIQLHSSDYVNMIVSAEKTGAEISTAGFELRYDKKTFSNARLSAGMTIDVIQNVLNHERTNGFIISTSPGHRADSGHGNGTSIFNNIALALDSVLTKKTIDDPRKSSLALIDSNNHVSKEGATPIENAICHMVHAFTPCSTSINDDGSASLVPAVTDKNNNTKVQIERVLIVDLTCEHGCGLQSIYYESDQVFYLSVHQNDNQPTSSYHSCGENQGMGYTMNVPLASLNGVRDRDYLSLMNELIIPIVNEFQPQFIVVCVDFHIQQLTPLGYAGIIEQLSKISDGRLVVALDGGLADISSKSAHVQSVLSVLIGKLSGIAHKDRKDDSDINSDVRHKIDLIKEKHKQYWPCFK